MITLNTWGGRAGKDKLLDFFKRHKDTDVFCLQEIWSAPYLHLEGQLAGALELNNSKIMVYGLQEITAALPGFKPYFRPHHGDHYGLLMMVKDQLTILEEGEVFVYREKGYVPEGDVGNHARNLQYIKIIKNGIGYCVINFHGLWNGMGKTDSDDRLLQSKKIIDFIGRQANSKKVICGDFNLLPWTESLRMIEDYGMDNLVKQYNVTSTRTSYYKKNEKFADYILVSRDVKVWEFRVMEEEVSDHAPLLIEFE